MNREEFISYLKEPANLDKKSLPEINELIEEYPFFQSGHLLFLKNLNNLDHIRFGSQLKKSSPVISNRERLYDLLFPVTDVDTDITVESGIEIKPAKPGISEAGPVPVIENPEEEKFPEESHESDANANLEELKEESKVSPIQESIDSGKDKSSDDLRAQVERRLAEIQGEDPPEMKAKNVFEKLKSEDVKDEEEQAQETIAPEEESFDTEAENEAGELLLLGDEKEVGDLPEDIEHPHIEEVEEKDVIFSKESLLDLDYPLQTVDSEDAEGLDGDHEEVTISSEAEMEKEIKSSSFEDKIELKEEIHSFESWLNLLGTGHSEEDPGEMNESVSGQREIIDRFIQDNPRIQPNQDDYYDKGDMSAESVSEKDELFTETLANIYIKQGYYSKAIFFYQELSLKFPEKSTYFARRIKEIEKRINKL